jgi:hypothetical protein
MPETIERSRGKYDMKQRSKGARERGIMVGA